MICQKYIFLWLITVGSHVHPYLVPGFLLYNHSTITGDKEEDIPFIGVLYDTLISSLDSMGEEYTPSSHPLLIFRLGISFLFCLGHLIAAFIHWGFLSLPPLLQEFCGYLYMWYVLAIFRRELVHHVGGFPQTSLRSYHLALLYLCAYRSIIQRMLILVLCWSDNLALGDY